MGCSAEGAAFFKTGQKIFARPRGDAGGVDMFSDIRSFAFSDPRTGSLQTRFGTLGSAGATLWRIHSSGHTIELSERKHVTILLPLRGRVDVRTGAQELGAATGEALIFGPNRRTTSVRPLSAPRYEALAVLVPSDAPDWNALAIGPDLSTRLDAGLHPFVRHLYNELDRPGSPMHRPRAQEAAVKMIWEYVNAAMQDAASDLAARSTPSASLALTRKAEEIMRERFFEAISISDIARQLSIGERTLQIAFRQRHNATPLEFLARIRLEAAHSRLLSAGQADTVSHIAMDCGFSHFGRFSQAYRNAFGEPPSQVLRRSQQRA